MRVNNGENNELIKKWFKEEIAEGENGIIIYPNLQTFRKIYMQYVKDELAKEKKKKKKKIIVHAINN